MIVKNNFEGKSRNAGTAQGFGVRRALHKLAGFSLVELISVVALVSVISGFAVVGVNTGAGGTNLETGARKVANLLHLARSQAISRNLPDLEKRLKELEKLVAQLLKEQV